MCRIYRKINKHKLDLKHRALRAGYFSPFIFLFSAPLYTGPRTLSKCAGFSKGLTTLDNALQKEVAVLKEGARALAQATRPERAISVAGTKIIQKLPESVLREAENLSKNRPGLEFVKRAEAAVEKSNTVCREIVLPKVKTFEQARNKALEIVGDLGPNSQPVIGRLKQSAGFGKIIGRRSADKKMRWRLDYDHQKGPHINVINIKAGKGINSQKYVIPFEGTEETFISLLKHLNG